MMASVTTAAVMMMMMMMACPRRLLSYYVCLLVVADMGLLPFSTYEYAVVAVNSVGKTHSDPANATTDEEAPSSVEPPSWHLKPNEVDTIFLNWTDPITPNGVVTAFMLSRNGVEVYRGLGYGYEDTNSIQPYKVYTYSLRACTTKGCTDSEEVKVATKQEIPHGVRLPLVTAEGPTALLVTWQAPSAPNGIIQYYNLTVSNGSVVRRHRFTGDTYTFRVTDLISYGRYEVVLLACTSAGCKDSSPVFTRTAEALPEGLKDPVIVVIDSHTAEVYWQPPEHPNGVVTNYDVVRNAETVATVTGDDHMYVDTRLQSEEKYTYSITVTNGAGSVHTPTSTVEMPLVTPVGIKAPRTATAFSPNEVYLEWELLNEPNLDQYQVMLDSGQEDSRSIRVPKTGQATLRGLQPYTEYNMRIRACLRGVVNSCGVGPGVVVRTLEDVPEGMQAPVVVAKGPNTVDVAWKEPVSPNGAIREYRVVRRRYEQTAELLVNIVPGNLRDLSFVNSGPDLEPYYEYEYRIIAINSKGQTSSPWVLVRMLAAPPTSQSAPRLYALSAYSIRASWRPPKKTNGVIERYRVDYQARWDDPTRFPSPTEQVSVDARTHSAQFSGLMPFMTYAVRIVAINHAGATPSEWVETRTLQAAPADVRGFRVEPVDTGEAAILRWALPGRPNGVVTEYRIYDREIATPIYQGSSQLFEYRRLQPHMFYDVQLEACTAVGCGKGQYQRIQTAETMPSDPIPPVFGFINSTAAEVRWRVPVKPNGVITKYEVYRRSMVDDREKRNVDSIPNAVLVYYTKDTLGVNEFSFVDTNLKAYTRYQYMVRAINSKGFVDSDWVEIRTEQAASEGLDPPIAQYLGTDPFSLRVSWGAPRKPSGVILSYQLQRNSSTPLSFLPTDDMAYTDIGLKAYTWYSYTVTVCTAGGCSTSAPTLMRTLETAPLHVVPPTITPVNSTTLRITWTQPQIANGEITRYELLVDGVSTYVGRDTHTLMRSLIPDHQYEFVLLACTNGGCSESLPAQGRPAEAAPRGIAPPMLIVMGSSSVQVSWTPPSLPNGNIGWYELRRNGELVYTGLALSYQDFGLTPGTRNAYSVTAYNTMGSVQSPEATTTTYASSPAGLQPPRLFPLGPSSVRVEWSPPAMPNGAIYNYTLLVGSDVVFAGMGYSFVVQGLESYTQHDYRVQACTPLGCTVSQPAKTRTMEAPPAGQSPPILQPQANQDGSHDGVLVTWDEPRRANGEVQYYELSRRRVERQPAEVKYSSQRLIYNGTMMTYLDKDPLLRPYSEYEYRVTAVNRAGSVASIWDMVRTYEAAPTRVSPPTFSQVTANLITVEVAQPQQPNGDITSYYLTINGTQEPASRAPIRTVGHGSPLHPHTIYVITATVCTAGGCSTSPPAHVRTAEAPPTGLLQPIVAEVTPTSAIMTWGSPAQPNGVITRYELKYRTDCPVSSQPQQLPCSLGDVVTAYSGEQMRLNVTGLAPYTNYLVQVHAYNGAGSMNSSAISLTTRHIGPEYVAKPTVVAKDRALVVDWSKSFLLNGRLDKYILYTNGYRTYSGFSEQTTVVRENYSKVYTFSVTLVTHVGNVTSDSVTFDSAIDAATHRETFDRGSVTSDVSHGAGDGGGGVRTTATPKLVVASPFYKEIWFIIIIALIGMLIVFVVLACCLKNTGRKAPYMRERVPLPPKPLRQAKLWQDAYPCYDSALAYTEPKYALAYSTLKDPMGAQAYNPYLNQAYSPSLPQSRTPSPVLRLSSKRRATAANDDDDDDDDGLAWIEQLSRPSSSATSLAMDSDAYSTVRSLRSHPYSITHKQHQIFPDTHL